MKRLWICLLAFALLTGCGDSGDMCGDNGIRNR